MNADRIAYEWLKGEDEYQWRRGELGKFTIAEDTADLYKGDGAGWDSIFHNRWTNIAAFRDGGPELVPKTIIHIGKMASGARALEVTLNIAASGEVPEDVFDQFNNASWADFQVLANNPSLLISNDWQAPNFHESKVGSAYRYIGLPLRPDTEVTWLQQVRARHFKIRGFAMFAGYLSTLDDLSLLPRPGLSGGDVEPWGDFNLATAMEPAEFVELAN